MNDYNSLLLEEYLNKGGGMFDISGYKPQKVEDSFALMSGKSNVCQVNSCLIDDVVGGTSQRDGKEFAGYKRLRYELQVVSEKYQGRRVWKSFNLDSEEKSGKKEKTPTEKLADIMFTVGLEFKDIEELQTCAEKFCNFKLDVSFGKIPADKSRDGTDVQLHTILGIAEEGAENKTTDTPSF